MPPEKKRKRNSDAHPSHSKSNGSSNTHDSSASTSKPSAVFKPSAPRKSTLSIALPGSIIANAKSHDAKTYLAGSIARALAVFCVDEVIIFDDTDISHTPSASSKRANDEEGYTALSDPSHFLSHILSYLETPPHLRKALFPMHPNLRTAGTLPSLDMPHHLRANEYSPYREGVVTSSSKSGSEVDLGLSEPYSVKGVQIPSKSRVTLKLSEGSVEAEAVGPAAPREEGGYYWGYSVRRCGSLSGVLTECPFEEGYDLSFGTSERGVPISELLASSTSSPNSAAPSGPIPRYKHMLLCFGGVAGLEHAANNDSDLQSKGITGKNVSGLFDYYVNLVPGQGSRTIRTEEAVWLGLMGLRSIVENNRAER